MNDTKALAEDVAPTILSSWEEWSNEAYMVATVEQDNQAYDDMMLSKLVGVLHLAMAGVRAEGWNDGYEHCERRFL